jgi:hypothetical protein
MDSKDGKSEDGADWYSCAESPSAHMKVFQKFSQSGHPHPPGLAPIGVAHLPGVYSWPRAPGTSRRAFSSGLASRQTWRRVWRVVWQRLPAQGHDARCCCEYRGSVTNSARIACLYLRQCVNGRAYWVQGIHTCIVEFQGVASVNGRVVSTEMQLLTWGARTSTSWRGRSVVLTPHLPTSLFYVHRTSHDGKQYNLVQLNSK